MQLGYKNVYRDAKGFPEWKAAGLPVQNIPADQSRPVSEPENAGPLVRMGDALDLIGSLRRRSGSQPDSVRISVDSDHGLIFRRQGRSGSGKTGSSRFVIPRRSIGDKLSPGRSGGSYGKPDGSGTSKPHRVGGCCRCSRVVRHKPLWILGAATSPEPYKRGIQVLCRILWHAVHGLDPRCRSCPVFGTFRTGFAHLGGKHGQPLVGLPHLLHAQPRFGRAALFPGDVLWESGKAPRFGRVDACG